MFFDKLLPFSRKKQKLSDRLYINPECDSVPTHGKNYNHDSVSLQNIRHFWQINEDNYIDNFKNASTDEYLVYGKTLMLWGFQKASPLKAQFPVYFERECHISNPKKLQIELLYNSYIEPASLNAILETYKMPELKIIADSVGCSKSGKKSELIHRICENIDDDMANSVISNSKLFMLSEKGKRFLDSNYDYVELHRHWRYNVSLYDFNKNRIPSNRKRTFNDNIFNLISQRIYRNTLHRHYYMIEYDYHALYEIAISEHHFDIALDNYLRFLYIKSCCIRTAQYYATDFPHSNFNEKNEFIFGSQDASPIVELSNFFNKSCIKYIYNDKSLPPSFLTENELTHMIEDMITSMSFDYMKYNKLIITRLKKYSKI